MSKKYYATITLEVLVLEATREEAELSLDEATTHASEIIEDLPSYVDLLDSSFKITKVE